MFSDLNQKNQLLLSEFIVKIKNSFSTVKVYCGNPHHQHSLRVKL